MSVQAKDPFIWDGNEYIFVGAENVYSLFDPDKFNLKLNFNFTGCWKGFVICFKLENNQLYLHELHVLFSGDQKPTINGVRATQAEDDLFSTYHDINLPLTYTGTVTIGDKLLPRFYTRAFTGPHSYEHTFELTFKDGILQNYRESTGEYQGI